MTCPDNTIRIYQLPGAGARIVPAPVTRDWMEKYKDRAAYRCLPMNIANAHGWQVLVQSDFRLRWNGKSDANAIEFEYSDPNNRPAISHFGMGIVTFHIDALIRTPPGVAIYATGPVNSVKMGLAPLSGIVETDWLPFTFTMNWQLYAKDHWISFARDEPFCMFFPVRLDEIEAYSVEELSLEDDPELKKQIEAFSQSRRAFLDDLSREDSDAFKAKWQRDYFRGLGIDRSTVTHRTALKLARPKPAE